MQISRDVVVATGNDARSYLHGQLSQRLDDLAVGAARWAMALEPTGKIVGLTWVHCRADDRFELLIDPGYGDELANRLRRFLLRVDVELTVETTTVGLEDVAASWGRPVIDLLGSDVGDDADAIYERRRVAAIWPAMGSEIEVGATIPAETGLVVETVDRTKGCYPGQELVERMDSRGASGPRQLRRFETENLGGDVAVGMPIIDPASDPDADPVGTVTSVAGEFALGYVRRGAELGVGASDLSNA